MFAYERATIYGENQVVIAEQMMVRFGKYFDQPLVSRRLKRAQKLLIERHMDEIDRQRVQVTSTLDWWHDQLIQVATSPGAKSDTIIRAAAAASANRAERRRYMPGVEAPVAKQLEVTGRVDVQVGVSVEQRLQQLAGRLGIEAAHTEQASQPAITDGDVIDAEVVQDDETTVMHDETTIDVGF